MQRLFEVRPFRPFSRRRLALLFLRLSRCLPPPSLFPLLFALFRREAASAVRRGTTSATTSPGEMLLLARREDLERRIFRDTKGNCFTAKWIDYSVSRSRQRREERRLLARAGRREQCSAAHLRFCLDERMEIALL